MNQSQFVALKQQIKEKLDLSSTVSDAKLMELIEEAILLHQRWLNGHRMKYMPLSNGCLIHFGA